MGFISEFKKFVMRGNVVDMAVGIIIGGAFGTIISSLVNDVIMPPIGLLIGGVDFAQLGIIIKHAATEADADVVIRYGAFLNTVITFLIIALTIFIVIKGLNKLERNKKQPEPDKAPEPTAEEKLLAEIRDLLKKK